MEFNTDFLNIFKFQGKISNSSTFLPRFVVETWAPALSPKVPHSKVQFPMDPIVAFTAVLRYFLLLHRLLYKEEVI